MRSSQAAKAIPREGDLSGTDALGYDDGRALALDVLKCVLTLLRGDGTEEQEAAKDRICRAVEESTNAALKAGFDEAIVGSKASIWCAGGEIDTPDAEWAAAWAARFRQEEARRAECIKRGDAEAAADSAAAVSYLAREFHLRTNWRFAIQHSAKFQGRKPGSVGPIRKAVRRLLIKNGNMKNPELWKQLSATPPKGWTFLENRLGKYIEGPAANDGMDYARFCNIASAERAKL